ncbi:hypothetical protein M422DRAFT_66921 [Sphaerobolus stellatus SS14]|uniref:RING-type domain-containing protein n=1 Tax=Sphaerobolus stellatus (strain SS14) TaxID=990650 RepID=A0A0C9W2N8_SPHS4|nr:hypothetical protein M422DRAFT_66921 [Sphaerobolus stellatus SS14]
MASINGYCPVCRDDFNSERRAHSIPCGHLFCIDCLTRMRGGHAHARCPFCRLPFRVQDIRWLYFNYEYDTFSHEAQYSSSDISDSNNIPQWLVDSRVALEERIYGMIGHSNFSQEDATTLSSDVHAWLAIYYQSSKPSSTRALISLEIAAPLLAELCKQSTHVSAVKEQLTKLRYDYEALHKGTLYNSKLRREAELRLREYDIEIRALRELNSLYREKYLKAVRTDNAMSASERPKSHRSSTYVKTPMPIANRSSNHEVPRKPQKKKGEPSIPLGADDIFIGRNRNSDGVQRSVSWVKIIPMDIRESKQKRMRTSSPN